MEFTLFKKVKPQSEHPEHLWQKENQTKKHLQAHTYQFMSRFLT